MARIPTSSYTPSPLGPLDWSADPLWQYRARKSAITPGLARTGMDFNRSLYAPDSVVARAVVSGAAPAARPEYWQGPTAPVAAGAYSSRYGMASVTFPTASPGLSAPPVSNPNLPVSTPVPTPSPMAADLNDDSALLPIGGAAPSYQTAGPVDVNAGLPPSPVNVGSPIVTPTAERTVSAIPLGRTPAEQTQRYYDRKFMRNSRDPVGRMQARRIDGRAPNVSARPNPVRFKNDMPGHSDWEPY